jgi:hypothetical protein
LVVDGHAAVHGHPRYTKDMGVWVALEPDNGASIVKKNKKASGRHQDLADLENLQNITGRC